MIVMAIEADRGLLGTVKLEGVTRQGSFEERKHFVPLINLVFIANRI